jgi:hypothetical protein
MKFLVKTSQKTSLPTVFYATQYEMQVKISWLTLCYAAQHGETLRNPHQSQKYFRMIISDLGRVTR